MRLNLGMARNKEDRIQNKTIRTTPLKSEAMLDYKLNVLTLCYYSTHRLLRAAGILRHTVSCEGS